VAVTLKDRGVPHNPEAEAACLGALLLAPAAIPEVIQFIRPDDFYNGRNRRVFAAILALYNKGDAIDLITVTDELKAEGELEAAGGASHVTALSSAVPTSANVAYYARIVQDCSIRRRLAKIASQIIARAQDDSVDARQTIEEAEQQILDVTNERYSGSYVPVREIIPETIATIEKHYRTKESYTGVPTGFPDLDNLTSGFQTSEFIVIGARPSVGKTALALSMAANISIRIGKPVGFFTLEMSRHAIGQRLLSSEARLDSRRLRTGMLKPSDFTSITDAAARIYDAPLFVEDSPNMSILDLRAMARRMRLQDRVEILFVDYLTLVSSENRELARHEQIAEISRSLKALARELEIPIVALSQVRRETEGKQPSLADIRESGSIEQDADVVIFLHRERHLGRDAAEDDSGDVETELIVAKQRNGPVGTVKIAFVPRYTRFESLSRETP
jgi:replicative DNA helicase